MNKGKKDHLRVGHVGEQVAADFLIHQGYVLTERNTFYSVGEIDLVMRDPKGVVCFVEVKTRSVELSTRDKALQDEFAQTSEMLHSKKIKKLTKAIYRYLHDTKQIDKSWRLDAVCVLLDESANQARCRHYQSVTDSF